MKIKLQKFLAQTKRNSNPLAYIIFTFINSIVIVLLFVVLLPLSKDFFGFFIFIIFFLIIIGIYYFLYKSYVYNLFFYKDLVFKEKFLSKILSDEDSENTYKSINLENGLIELTKVESYFIILNNITNEVFITKKIDIVTTKEADTSAYPMFDLSFIDISLKQKKLSIIDENVEELRRLIE